jgi:hypothetical protein
VDLAGFGRLRSTEAGACHRRRREAALGASATTPAIDPDPRAEGFRNTAGSGRHSGEASETLREISWTPEGQPLRTGKASSGAQNGRLSKSEKPWISIGDHPRTSSEDQLCLKDKLKRLPGNQDRLLSRALQGTNKRPRSAHF